MKNMKRMAAVIMVLLIVMSYILVVPAFVSHSIKGISEKAPGRVEFNISQKKAERAGYYGVSGRGVKDNPYESIGKVKSMCFTDTGIRFVNRYWHNFYRIMSGVRTRKESPSNRCRDGPAWRRLPELY